MPAAYAGTARGLSISVGMLVSCHPSDDRTAFRVPSEHRIPTGTPPVDCFNTRDEGWRSSLSQWLRACWISSRPTVGFSDRTGRIMLIGAQPAGSLISAYAASSRRIPISTSSKAAMIWSGSRPVKIAGRARRLVRSLTHALRRSTSLSIGLLVSSRITVTAASASDQAFHATPVRPAFCVTESRRRDKLLSNCTAVFAECG